MDWTTEENLQHLEEMLQKAKTTLRITTDAFDDEIRDIIKSGYEDLGTRGVLTQEQKESPLVIRAILTYVRFHFGEPENPDRLKRSYDEQKAQLMTTTLFTNWED